MLKSKFYFVAAILTVVALLAVACATPSSGGQVTVDVSCDDFYQRQHISQDVEVAVGDSLIVTLCSNPSTGFQWAESAEISDQTVLKQVGHKFVSPQSEPPPPPGTPGQEVWTFEARRQGTSTISMEYSRPWEGGEKGEWIFNLTVGVK